MKGLSTFIDSYLPASVKPFGQLEGGREVQQYTLRSQTLEAVIIPYGARIVSLKILDKTGLWEEVTLGFESIHDYVTDHSYLGAAIGRFANRIANGRFEIEGRSYELTRNDGEQCLHGGDGFEHRFWNSQLEGATLTLSYCSAAAEAGFPGEVRAIVRYSVLGSDLKIDYEASSDQSTFVNLTNHTYFNLAGPDTVGADVLDHQLFINAAFYLPVDRALIPLPGMESVDGTPFDFGRAHEIGARVNDADDQISVARGYDHCWVLDRSTEGALELAARLRHPRTGRVLEVLTTEPGLQFYSGNFLDGAQTGRGGIAYGKHAGLCLETQHFPDSPNRPDFPPTLLVPGDVHQSTTVYRFSIESPDNKQDAS